MPADTESTDVEQKPWEIYASKKPWELFQDHPASEVQKPWEMFAAAKTGTEIASEPGGSLSGVPYGTVAPIQSQPEISTVPPSLEANPIAGVSAEEIAAQNAKLSEPLIKLGDFLIKGPGEGKTPAEEGINASLRNNINALTSPENLDLLALGAGIGAAGQVAKRAVAAGFALLMGKEVPHIASELGAEFGKPEEQRDKTKIAQLITDASIATGFAAMAGAHALGPAKTISAAGAPETAKALEQTLTEFQSQAKKEGAAPITEKGLENASNIEEATAVHGDLQPPPIAGEWKVPESQSGAGVQSQATGGIQPSPAGVPTPNAPIGGEGLGEKGLEQSGPETQAFTPTQPGTEGTVSAAKGGVFGEGPGSPSITQGADPKAAIETLEESFRNIKGPKPSIGEQVKQAFDIGEKFSQAKDAVSSGIQALKSSGDFLINKWQGVPELDDMLKAKGELSAEIEKRGWRVRQFVKTVEKAMPTERQRAAVLKWVDSGGDMTELQRGLNETPAQYKQAYSDAMKLSGDDLIAAKNIRSYFEERLDDAIDSGVLQEGVEDYIHRLYERDPKSRKEALAYVQSGILQQNPALVKKRIFQFDWEAEKAGLNPVQDFLPRIAQYEASLSKAIAARKFVRQMTGFEGVKGMVASDGRPVLDAAGLGVPIEDATGVREATLIKPSFKPSGDTPKNNRMDYVERDYPALRKWRWATKDAGGKPIFVQGNLLIHPDMVGRIDALLEPSKVRYGRFPRIGRAALGVSSTVKQTMLDLSGFHQVQITIHGMEHKVMPWKILKDIDFNNPNVDGLLKGGITLGGEYYSSHHGEGLVGSALTRHIPVLGLLMESYHNWLFQSYIPRIKMSMALNALERNRSRYAGKMSEEQILAKTASEANSAFGELNYTTLERSRTARDISRIIMLAPDFLEARARFAGGALEKGGKFGGQEQRAALLLGALTMYITSRMANKMINDEYHFEPENAFSIVANGHSYSLRTVQGDIMHLLDDPLSFWMHRLNPVFGRTVLELATGRDEFGRKRSAIESLWDSAKNTIPISLRSSKERTLWESMANSFGLTTRRWSDVDKAFKLAGEWKKAQGIQEPGEFIYDSEKDPLRALKVALSRNDEESAAKEIKRLVDSNITTEKKLRAYFKRYGSMPFTGSKSNDRTWMETLNEDQRKIVEGAKAHKESIRELFEESLYKSGL